MTATRFVINESTHNIICDAELNSCGCKGEAECRIFEDLGDLVWGCAEAPRCTGPPEFICVCDTATQQAEWRADLSTWLQTAGPSESEVCEWTASVRSDNWRLCPDRKLARGLFCWDDFCGAKEIYCCSYPGASEVEDTPISKSDLQPSGQISEEFPNYFARSQTGFVKGIECEGDDCDNVTLLYLNDDRLVQDPRGCFLTDAITDEDPDNPFITDRAECPSGYYLTGLTCNGSRCDNLQLYCCSLRFVG